MKNANGTADSCFAAFAIAAHPLVLFLSCFTIVISAIITVQTSILLRCLLCHAVFHPNLRTIVANYATATGLYGVSRIIPHLFQLTLTVSSVLMDDECIVEVEKRVCFLMQGLEWWSGGVITIAMPLVVAERIWASVHYDTYEHAGSKVFSLLASILLWTTSAILVADIWTQFSGQDLIPYCNAHQLLNNPPRSLDHTLFSIFVIQFVSFCAFCLLRHRDVRLRQSYSAQHSLSSRYQLSDNVRMNRMLAQLVFCHFAAINPLLVVVQGMPWLRIGSRPAEIIIFELSALNFQTLAISLVVLCCRNNQRLFVCMKPYLPGCLHRLFTSTIHQRQRSPVVAIVRTIDEGQRHFRQLNEMWAISIQRQNT